MPNDTPMTFRDPATADGLAPPGSLGTAGGRGAASYAPSGRSVSEAPPSAAPASRASGSANADTSASEGEWSSDDIGTLRTTEAALQVPLALRERNRASLTLITGLNAGQVFPLVDTDTIIGRSRAAHVRIDDVGISRQHSRLVQTKDGKFVVEDLRSTNGTFVGGRRVTRCELESGDHVQIGPNVVLRFAVVDEAEESLAKQLYESSTRDPLTRAFNRKYFVERLQSEVAYAHRHRTALSLILFDLDHFKAINDGFGHLAGDEVLRAVAGQVTKLIRAEDVFARFGGEEFVVLVRGIEPESVVVLGDRIRRAVDKLVIVWNAHTLRATISVGIAHVAECEARSSRGQRADHALGEAALLLADERLYRAKSTGRNRVCAE